KQRWFRLKGNLLFYFKSCGEPAGVIVLERCRVERIHHETRPYSFVLAFENDDSRTYVLSAFSQPELDSWILAVRMSSYEGLKAMYYELTNKINTLTGKYSQKTKSPMATK
ncbi:Sesquipedalian-1, partial [Geodia barretti]